MEMVPPCDVRAELFQVLALGSILGCKVVSSLLDQIYIHDNLSEMLLKAEHTTCRIVRRIQTFLCLIRHALISGRLMVIGG